MFGQHYIQKLEIKRFASIANFRMKSSQNPKCTHSLKVRKQCVKVILRQIVPVTDEDQHAKKKVISGAEALGVKQALSRLVDNEELGCHRALLSLLAQQKRFRPEEGLLGCFTMSIWETILEFARTKAASRIGSASDELLYAESQISGQEQSVRWCFDTYDSVFNARNMSPGESDTASSLDLS